MDRNRHRTWMTLFWLVEIALVVALIMFVVSWVKGAA
jgi:hypothetical protein